MGCKALAGIGKLNDTLMDRSVLLSLRRKLHCEQVERFRHAEQGIADLNTVDDNFKSQMLNCANTLICHRLNDQESAEAVAGWMGTKDTFTVTAQYDPKNKDASLSSVRSNKTYVIHPEAIKQGLSTGEAYYVSKVGRFG